MVTTIAVAIAIWLAAPTLATYPGYFNSIPYPYQHLGPHYPFTVPAGATPLIYSQHAPPLFTPQPLPPIGTLPVEQPTQIYSPPDIYRGFAYQTTYSDGGVSQVVFVRGPDAKALLEQSIRSFSFTSFPVLPLTKLSSEQQNNTTKPGKEAEPSSTTSDVKAHENTPTDKKAAGLSTTAAPVILPTLHSTVTPFIGPHAPGAFFYSVQVRPPEIDNSLTPTLPYFAKSFFNPPNDFFRRISIPPLFAESEGAKSENNEASSNSSDEVSSNSSEGDSSTPSNDVSSPSPADPSSLNDETTPLETDTQSATDSPGNNGSDVSEENSDSNEESNASNTEPSVSSESSSSGISSDGSSSDFNTTGKTSNSTDESSTDSNKEADSESSTPSAEDTSEDAGSSTDTVSSSTSTDGPLDSDNNSTEVHTTVVTE